jgi:cytidylate kinase
MQRPIVAVDGAAGSGKSTLARGLARSLHVPYINTGAMYRALAAAALRTDTPIDDGAALLDLARDLRFSLRGDDPAVLIVEGYTDQELSSPQVESTVSTVARHPAVRAWMRDRQRALGANGAVMEGRDIATVVFPEARVKLFLRAHQAARGVRRATERGAGDQSGVTEAIRARDERDARTNPLEPTADAVVIDTSELGIDETLATAIDAVRRVWPDAV